jgi:simple sugar transport system permease protein
MIGNILTAAAPLVLTSIGVLFTVLSGRLCLAAEGFMVFGAFFGYIFSIWTGNSLLGIILSSFLSCFLGFLLSVFIQKTRSDPFIAALALNLAAEGISSAVSRSFFNSAGVLRSSELLLPNRYFFAVTAAFCALAAAIVLRNTVFGLRLKASGISGRSASWHGLHPARYIHASWAIAAFCAALGGAALSFRVGVYAPGGIAGRGWVSIAAVYMGFQTVPGVSAASLFFACTAQLVYQFQKIPTFPASALLGIPSLLALILYAISKKALPKFPSEQ